MKRTGIMKNAVSRLWVLVAACLLPGAVAMSQETTATNYTIEKLADGLVFPEGPVWHPDGFLLFSDVHGGTIQQVKPEGGSVAWFDQGKQTNGLILGNDKTKIYACCYSDRELLEIDAKTKEFKVLSKAPLGKPLNNVNDVAVDREGHVFFTDPLWGAKPGDLQGVYRYSPADSTTTLAIEVEKQPNGIVITPDHKYVYVARSGGNDIWRYKWNPGGTITDGEAWFKLEPKGEPDGMTIDSKGFLYIAQAGNGHVCIVSPEGKRVQSIKVFDRMCTNVELEPGNENILYVTGGGKSKEKVGSVHKITFSSKPWQTTAP